MTQTKNKTVFIPHKSHNQNLPPHQHTVCAPTCNISHVVSTLLHCGLQNTQSASCSSSSVELSSKRQLGQCPNPMECQTELDPGKPFSSVFLKHQEEHSTKADWFWI